MIDPFLTTLFVGGGLLACGFALGYMRGVANGAKDTVNELFSSGVVTPEELLKHYANAGNDRARDALAKLNAYKREMESKEKNDV